MDIEIAKQVFDRDGFAVLDNVLDQEQVQDVTANIDRYRTQVASNFPEGHEGAMYQDPGERNTLIRMNRMQDHDDYFRDLPNSDPWLNMARTLLGEDVHNVNVVYFNKPPRSVKANHPSPPHQDNFYYHLDPPNLMSFWVPLEPVDAENGCLRYVAGSHQRGIREHAASSVYGFSQGISDYGPDDWAHEKRVALDPGQAIAHHCMTIHRADANESDTRNRVALVMIYQGENAKRDEVWHARHIEIIKEQHTALGRKATV